MQSPKILQIIDGKKGNLKLLIQKLKNQCKNREIHIYKK
jgi:hypothetical protein